MTIKDAISIVGDNVVNLVKNPKDQFKRAGQVIVDGIRSEGMVGSAAKDLQGRHKRVNDAVNGLKNGGLIKAGKSSTPYKCK